MNPTCKTFYNPFKFVFLILDYEPQSAGVTPLTMQMAHTLSDLLLVLV